jgi:hypothetical protein
MIPVIPMGFTMRGRSVNMDIEISDEDQQRKEKQDLIDACTVVDKLCKSEGTWPGFFAWMTKGWRRIKR